MYTYHVAKPLKLPEQQFCSFGGAVYAPSYRYIYFRYAFLLHEEKELGKLDKLATDLFYITETHPATWVALGYRALSRHEYKKAIYLAVQATKLNQLCLTVCSVIRLFTTYL